MADATPLKMDYTNVMADAIGEEHGLVRSDLAALEDRAAACVREMAERRHADVGFPELPNNKELVAGIQAVARELRGWCKNFVVLGIGGSALGNRAISGALNHPMHNLLPHGHASRLGGPRLFVMDNVDPSLLAGLMDALGDELPRTCFNVITKSGSTAETMSQFLHFRDVLRDCKDCDVKRQLVVTTEPERREGGQVKHGLLRKITEEEGYTSFPIPPNVGGRFSCLSAVGLLSSAVLGADIDALLAGAAAVDKRCSDEDFWANPAALYGAIHYVMYQHGRTISVFMPYSNSLGLVSDWYCQLWAESLGKRDGLNARDIFVGATPFRAVGVTDQHSTMQLIQDGAFDKIISLVEVETALDEILSICPSGKSEPELDYLARSSFNELLARELHATRCALREKHRPNLTLKMDRVSAYNLGQLLMMLEHATAFAGFFFQVDTFNQPGVELGKKYTYGLLGREGYDPPQTATIEADYTV